MCCTWVHLATTSQHSNYVPLEVYKHPQTAMQMKTKSSRWLRTSKHKILNIITGTLNVMNYVVQWHRGTYTLPSAGNYKGSEQIHHCRFVKLYLFCCMGCKFVILKMVWKLTLDVGYIYFYTVNSTVSKYSAQFKETDWLSQWGSSNHGLVCLHRNAQSVCRSGTELRIAAMSFDPQFPLHVSFFSAIVSTHTHTHTTLQEMFVVFTFPKALTGKQCWHRHF